MQVRGVVALGVVISVFGLGCTGAGWGLYVDGKAGYGAMVGSLHGGSPQIGVAVGVLRIPEPNYEAEIGLETSKSTLKETSTRPKTSLGGLGAEAKFRGRPDGYSGVEYSGLVHANLQGSNAVTVGDDAYKGYRFGLGAQIGYMTLRPSDWIGVRLGAGPAGEVGIGGASALGNFGWVGGVGSISLIFPVAEVPGPIVTPHVEHEQVDITEMRNEAEYQQCISHKDPSDPRPCVKIENKK